MKWLNYSIIGAAILMLLPFMADIAGVRFELFALAGFELSLYVLFILAALTALKIALLK